MVKKSEQSTPNPRLSDERLHQGWSQQDVADELGTTRVNISRWENGSTSPSPHFRQKLCQLFGKTAGELGLIQLKDVQRKVPNTHPHNLPIQPTSFIGREREVATVERLLLREDTRLLTLTGPGGVGKTRLALQVAAELSDRFADGVYFVNLAPLSDAAFVLPGIASTLDLKEGSGQTLLGILTAYARDKQLLLLLDNFEQVLDAAVPVAELLAACPRLKVLVTSRAVLHVRGEQQFDVPPLAVPDLSHMPDLAALAQHEAVALFLARAEAVKPEFQLTPVNAKTVAEICTRLDGLPLAIELAAAHVKLFSPKSLLARLGQRLAVLTGGARDAPTRQQTLRNTIAWSYHLLDAQEQRLFRWLSVFAGNGTLEAIEAVCHAAGSETINVFNTLTSLINKSLLQHTDLEDDEPRLSMLESVREYGLECLRASGENHSLQHQHALYYLALAEQVEPELSGPKQVERLALLDREHDNLRTALQWALGQVDDKAGQFGSELALRLGAALRVFWIMRGYWSEGCAFLERALASSTDSISPARAKALWTTATLAFHQDDYAQARTLAQESLALSRALSDTLGISNCLSLLGGIANNQSDYVTARALMEESLALARTAGDRVRIATVLRFLGEIVIIQGDYLRASALFDESLQVQKELGNKRGVAWSLLYAAWVLIVSQGNLGTARARLEESLALAREVNDKEMIEGCLHYLGQLAFSQDELERAHSLLVESLALAREIGSKWASVEIHCALAKVAFVQGDHYTARTYCEEGLEGARHIGSKDLLASALERLAEIVTSQGEATWAARLCAAAEALRESIGVPITPLERPLYDRMLAQARGMLGECAFAATWAEGSTMTPEQALALQDQEITAPSRQG